MDIEMGVWFALWGFCGFWCGYGLARGVGDEPFAQLSELHEAMRVDDEND